MRQKRSISVPSTGPTRLIYNSAEMAIAQRAVHPGWSADPSALIPLRRTLVLIGWRPDEVSVGVSRAGGPIRVERDS